MNAKEDQVTRPSHYNQHPSGVECIDITKHHSFNIGNVIKYCWRQGLKDSEPAPKDLKKAVRYALYELGLFLESADIIDFLQDEISYLEDKK